MSQRSDDAATKALDAIAKLCGCPEWGYPGQIVRDVGRVVAARDEARTVLREVEWMWLRPAYCCPVCEGDRRNGHATDCRLAKAIGGSR